MEKGGIIDMVKYYDKFLHACAGVIVSAFVYLVTRDPDYSILAAFVVGAAKELYDATGRGSVEILDFIATGIGGAVFVLLITRGMYVG